MLYDTGYTKFTANPSNATKQTYKTIGFQHRAISSSATSIIISTSAFVQATASSF
ncbi:MAG: hypothetical protein J6S85_03425 [Methanobrevibacter sp.]|nr:hypothetical protein [Methanobrevibacter sp.]